MFILIIVSVILFFVALFDIEDCPINLQELTMEKFSQQGTEIKPGWHMINVSGSSEMISGYKERSTLTQSFFSPECMEAWIAMGTLCDTITHQVIPHDLQKSMKVLTVHTWVNGSDTQLALWKEAIIKNDPGITLNGWRRPVGNTARHFRYCALPPRSTVLTLILICFRTHGELLYLM